MSPTLESGLCGCLNNMDVMVGQSLDQGQENRSLLSISEGACSWNSATTL